MQVSWFQQALLKSQGSAPEAFGSRIPSMASNFQGAAASFFEAARTSAGQSPAPAPAQQAQQMQQAAQQAWQSMPYLQMLQSLDSRQLQSLSTISASPPPSAGQQTGQSLFQYHDREHIHAYRLHDLMMSLCNIAFMCTIVVGSTSALHKLRILNLLVGWGCTLARPPTGSCSAC